MTNESSEGRYRIGIDIGGTFTDVVLVAPDGRVWPIKVLSTPRDFSRAVIDGLRLLVQQTGIALSEIEELVHGTTVATNAILEQNGARTALITTVGFRDVLELRRVRMPQLYNIQWEKPEPLVPRYLRFEVRERIDAKGEVLTLLADEDVERIVTELKRERVEAVAICFINSYLNPAHEQRVAMILRERLPNVNVSVSSDISRELKEFERTSTTVIDAYVKPVVDRYLSALEAGIRALGIDGRLLVMQSNGAVMSVDAAREQPCFLIESGPAAGVIAGRALAERVNEPDLITFDMGGTTAKAALVHDGKIGLTDEYEVGAGITVGTRLMKGDGYLLRIPAVDLAEVGAGGGSIAWIDSGGRLQVGPRSAGADPGPACYGNGGDEPTITDANVLLGYIDPERFAGGSMSVDVDAARWVMEQLGDRLGMRAEDAALAVHVVGNARMGRSIRAVTVHRGLDAREFALLAFGGSGPLHAASLAAELGIARVIVPPLAGVLSAVGLCLANAGHHLVSSFRREAAWLTSFELLGEISMLQGRLRRQLDRLNYPPGDLRFETAADMRYQGQGFSLPVELDEALRDSNDAVERSAEAFVAQHERTFGHRASGDPIEFVNLHIRASLNTANDWPNTTATDAPDPTGQRTRPMLFRRVEAPIDVPLLTRADLSEPRHGPLAVEEADTSIIVPPDWRAWVDEWSNVQLERLAGANR
ncbi:MAG: hydantoinase/oxoprolinase family protein [Nitrolancea sp.]